MKTHTAGHFTWYFPDTETHFIEMLDINPEYQYLSKRVITDNINQLDLSVVLDIGANVGLWTRWFWGVGAQSVICFEPMMANFECLVENTKGLGQIDLRNIALSDRNGTLSLFTSRKNSNSGSATAFKPEGFDVETQVECRTLDSLKLAPTFIKMDVQGAERLVLAGGVDTLARHSPGIMTECDDPELGTIRYLEGLGYKVIGQRRHDYLLTARKQI